MENLPEDQVSEHDFIVHCACGKVQTPEDIKRVEQEFKDDWENVFKQFHDDNELGGSSSWLVGPNTVRNFIKMLLR